MGRQWYAAKAAVNVFSDHASAVAAWKHCAAMNRDFCASLRSARLITSRKTGTRFFFASAQEVSSGAFRSLTSVEFRWASIDSSHRYLMGTPLAMPFGPIDPIAINHLGHVSRDIQLLSCIASCKPRTLKAAGALIGVTGSGAATYVKALRSHGFLEANSLSLTDSGRCVVSRLLARFGEAASQL